ncbi:cytochrome-c peroxidase [Nostoc sp. C117]|uniref:cytochrome-c peroxidase n=1 Tax=Nostoc sp. C117 TaxID=3349875 RepID=UPI00370DC4BA
MGIIPLIVLVIIVTSLPIYFLLTSKSRWRKKQRIDSLLSKPLVSRFHKAMIIGAIIAIAIIAGNTVSAQVARPLAPLKTVKVQEPDNLTDFVKNKAAAIKLGKALFWDMQIGSDGVTACASCHFHAGADNRSKNQISPGLLRVNADKTANPDTVFDVGGAPNYQLNRQNFPFHQLSNPNDPTTVISDRNDVVSSQGVFNSEFVDVTPGNAVDQVKYLPDPVFNVGGKNVRRVEPRNTPTVINSVFNFRNFWDGRAQEIFNGVNEFGLRDPNAYVVKATTPSYLESVKVSINHASLASQAVGPPISSFEMSADGRTFAEIGDKFGAVDPKTHSVSKGKKLPRKMGKKLLPLRPLGKQIVDPQDSVLGTDSRSPQTGLHTLTYQQLIAQAFKPEWWASNRIIQVNPDGSRTFVKKPDRSVQTNEYTLMEYNFPLFFGLAVQMYESTLIASDTPLDRFLDGKADALSDQQKLGKELFEGKAACTTCHNGAELTRASVSAVQEQRIGILTVPNFPRIIFDNGFFNIGVRPTLEDLAVGGNDPFGNPLSESRLSLLGTFRQLLGSDANTTVTSNDLLIADGSFKTPGLRNIELTAPYFHNGGYLTLQQVVDFYNRGGDFRQQSALAPLNLTEEEKANLVTFLQALTDERVRYEKAPFDHPQLFVPNGHPVNSNSSVTDDGTGKATDNFLEIPAVGKFGGNGTPNFLANQ